MWTDEQMRAATQALRDVAGACNGGTPESECVYMVTDGNCGCADMARAALDAVAAPEIERLTVALKLARSYIADEPIAHAVVVPSGKQPRGDHPSLLQVIDAALGDEQGARPSDAEEDQPRHNPDAWHIDGI